MITCDLALAIMINQNQINLLNTSLSHQRSIEKINLIFSSLIPCISSFMVLIRTLPNQLQFHQNLSTNTAHLVRVVLLFCLLMFVCVLFSTYTTIMVVNFTFFSVVDTFMILGYGVLSHDNSWIKQSSILCDEYRFLFVFVVDNELQFELISYVSM